MSLNRYHMVGMAHDISHGYTVGCVLEPYHNAQGVLSQVAEVLEAYGQEFTVFPRSRRIVHNGQLTVFPSMEYLPGIEYLPGTSFDVLVVPVHLNPDLYAGRSATVIEY